MNTREAFEHHWKETELTIGQMAAWVSWQAACEWQKQKDAEIVLDESVSDTGSESDHAYNTALKHASSAIINQGDGDA